MFIKIRNYVAIVLYLNRWKIVVVHVKKAYQMMEMMKCYNLQRFVGLLSTICIEFITDRFFTGYQWYDSKKTH